MLNKHLFFAQKSVFAKRLVYANLKRDPMDLKKGLCLLDKNDKAARSEAVLIIYNPYSRRYSPHILEAVRAHIARSRREVISIATIADIEHMKQAVNLCLRRSSTCVQDAVVIGGDGTLHLAVNALVDHSIVVGYIPSGTGNDFARGFYQTKEHPRSAEEWITQAVSGTIETIDLGQINGRYFVNVAGIGFDAQVVRQTYGKSRVFPGLHYMLAALKHLFLYPAKRMEISDTSDSLASLSKSPCFMLNFANSNYFGSGMKIAPHAHVSDGQLAYCFIENAGVWRKISAFIKLYSGQHTAFREVHCGHIQTAYIATPGLPIEADGEWLGETPARIQTLPRRLLIRRNTQA